jgi:nicotinate phosphoribosyltransferase
VYKLAELDGRPLLKLSTDKATLPGVKQVWRRSGESGLMDGDVIGLAEEEPHGTPLLVPVMREGRRLDSGREELTESRRRAAGELGALPPPLREIEPAAIPYRVEISDLLERSRNALARQVLG